MKIIVRDLTAEEEADRKAYEAGEADRAKAEVKALRQAAYQAEADPIYFQAQRDDTYTLEDWKAKVAEIDERYPYPVAKKKTKASVETVSNA